MTQFQIFQIGYAWEATISAAATSRYNDDSVTRLGDFWKFSVTNYRTEVAQMFGDFLVLILKNITVK